MKPEGKKPLVYLACPYSSDTQALREAREIYASAIAAELMVKGYAVFSPITHGHRIAQYLPEVCLLSHEFWMDQCLPILRKCDAVYVLPLFGWDTSKGVKAEILEAVGAAIPVSLLASYRTSPSLRWLQKNAYGIPVIYKEDL